MKRSLVLECFALLFIGAVFCAAVLYCSGRIIFFNAAGEAARFALARDIAAGAGVSGLSVHSCAPRLMHSAFEGMPAFYAGLASMLVLGRLLGGFAAFKAVMLVFGLGALGGMHFVLRRVFSRSAALLCVLFVGTNWNFINAVRHGFMFSEIVVLFFLWTGLALFVAGLGRRDRVFSCAACLFFGLGLWARADFAACILGAGAVFLLLGRRHKKTLASKLGRFRDGPCCGAAFALGALPFILFNLTCGLPTLCEIASAPGPGAGWSNWAFFFNLSRRAAQLGAYIAGDAMGLDFGVCNRFFLYFFVCALCWAAGAALFGPDGRMKTALRAMLVFYAVVFACSCIVISAQGPWQVLIVTPFVELVCALFAVFCGRLLARWSKVAGAGFVLALAIFWCLPQQRAFAEFSRKCFGGEGQFYGISLDERAVLCAALERADVKTVIAAAPMDAVLKSGPCRFAVLGFGMDGPGAAVGLAASHKAHGGCGLLVPQAGIMAGRRMELYAALRRAGFALELVDAKMFRGMAGISFEFCRVRADSDGGS